MIKKHSILIGILIALFFLFMATLLYPGGTYEDNTTIGYDWRNNYISNLLSPIAVNGAYNVSRPWAILGVTFLTVSFGVFFIRFSKRIKIKSAAFIIKYFGIGATFFGMLTVAPALHDFMVMISSILTLIIFFYITVILIKSKLRLLKILSIIFLLIFYLGAYMYFTRTCLEYMPTMQKIIFAIKITWVLSLLYFTKEEDFQHIT